MCYEQHQCLELTYKQLYFSAAKFAENLEKMDFYNADINCLNCSMLMNPSIHHQPGVGSRNAQKCYEEICYNVSPTELFKFTFCIA